MTFLAIDVGNTRLKWALYDAHRPAQRSSRMVPSSSTTSTAWPKALGQLPVPTRMLGCVVAGDAAKRRVQEQMEQMVRWDVEPQWVVSSAEEAGLTNGYDHPSRLGADRWVAMVGARHHVLARARHGRWWW
jgi:type III pantothenate kinase